jgi:hypothetical protein
MSSSQLPTAPEQFQGWLGKDKNCIGNLEHGSYTPKPFTDADVEIGPCLLSLNPDSAAPHYPASRILLNGS